MYVQCTLFNNKLVSQKRKKNRREKDCKIWAFEDNIPCSTELCFLCQHDIAFFHLAMLSNPLSLNPKPII